MLEIERIYLFCLPIMIPDLTKEELEIIEKIGAWVGESERRRKRVRR